MACIASNITVRKGLPTCTKSFVDAVRARNYPVLLSANQFARTYPRTHQRAMDFKRFAPPRRELLDGIDAALDSSGYVTAVRYGDYRWTVREYVADLVPSNAWAWWAALDYCCEPEIAQDRSIRLLRIAATASLYWQCYEEARRLGLSAPMPVLQGWWPSEYIECAEWLAIDQWPSLIGVGSVCRRAVHGPDGILKIVEKLDGYLPEHVKLHLFGAKGAALEALSGHERVASCDSMAWDARARRARPVGRTAAFRIEHMVRWSERQQARLEGRDRGPRIQKSFSFLLHRPVSSTEELAIEALALQHADLIFDRDLEYLDALWSLKRDAVDAMALIRRYGTKDKCLRGLEELLAGTAERFEYLLSNDLELARAS